MPQGAGRGDVRDVVQLPFSHVYSAIHIPCQPTTTPQDFTVTEPAHVGGLSGNTSDPFAAQRTRDNDPFASTERTTREPLPDLLQPPSAHSTSMPQDRRMSKEWDASKVPPSRFQKREGSIYATAGSRDGHTGRVRDRDQSFHEKLKTKGWL